MQVIINNLPASYIRVGAGPKILMIHGWGDSSATFMPIINEIKGKYECIAVDLPGFGGSAAPEKPMHLEDFAQFLSEFINKTNLGDIRAIIGHSNGGAVAITGLANGTLLAQKLVLLGSAGIRDVDKTKKSLLKISAKAAKVITAPLPQSTKTKLRQKSYKAIGSDMFVSAHMQETFKNVVAQDVRDYAKQLTLPTVLIYGSNDEATPVEYGQILEQSIKGSKLYVLEEAGHFVHHDQTAKTLEILEKFL